MSDQNQETVPRPTLRQLLAQLQALDDDMIQLSLEDQTELIEAGRVKVDNYKYIIDKLDAQAAYLKAREDEYAQARRVVENNLRRIRDNLVRSMQTFGFDQFAGQTFTVRLAKAPPSVEVSGDCDAAMKIRWPDYVRVKYEWDKTALRDALKSGSDPDVTNVAALKENVYPRFSVIKE